MGKIAMSNQPCLNPECGSSDGRQVYADGSSYCFVCQKYFSKAETSLNTQETFHKDRIPTFKKTYNTQISFNKEEILKLRSTAISKRKISKEVTEFYGVKIAFDENGNDKVHYYPYEDNHAFNVREVDTKSFHWVGNSDKLFGQDKFTASSGKRVIICEGEIDTLSLATASYNHYKRFYPILGLPSVSRAKTIINQRSWLRNFEEIVICMDSDDPGQEAQLKFAKILGADKVKLVKLKRKDVNEVLVNDGEKALLTAVWDAEKYIPTGILTRDQLWEQLVAYNELEAFPYPECLSGLNRNLKGMRGGEIALFVSGTGSGKSTLFREIMLHILSTSKEHIGIISLEESPAETVKKLSAMALQKNAALADIPLKELKIGFDKVFGDDRIMLLDHQGAIGDASIIDKMEYMFLMDCKKVFLDHITILASEGVDDLRGNEATDKIMSDLLKLVKKYPTVWLGMIAHLRKTSSDSRSKSFEEGRIPTLDDIKGSGALKQIAMDIIAFARNMNAESEKERNTVHMAVLKARTTGLTGPIGDIYYNGKTGRFTIPNFEIVSL